MREAGRSISASRSQLCAVAPLNRASPQRTRIGVLATFYHCHKFLLLGFDHYSISGPEGNRLRAKVHELGLDPVCGA